MKTPTTLCVAVILVLGFSTAVLAENIPGGIVFSDGKNVLYQNFVTNQITNLTDEIPEFQLKRPWAISENGQLLCWFEDGNFFVKDFVSKNNFEVKVESFWVDLGKTYFLPQAADISNLNISPNKENIQITYESPISDKGFLQTKLSYKEIMALDEETQSLFKRSPTAQWPFFKQVADTFNGIVHIVAEKKEAYCYGNATAWCPSQIPCLIEYEKDKISNVAMMPIINPAQDITIRGEPGTKIPPFLLAKRNACFPVWQKPSSFQNNEGMLAFIYRTEAGWGPIEIQSCSASQFGKTEVGGQNRKPPFWQLLINLKNCNGLAWRPDGSLTYLSDDNVFVLDAKQIEDGIKKSAAVVVPFKYPPVVNVAGMQLRYPPDVCFDNKIVNAAFAVKPVSFARSIKGDKLHWVSDDTFVFRGTDKILYSCTKGNITKLLEDIPAEFSYCEQPASK